MQNLTDDEKKRLMEEAPFAIGVEHINENWLQNLWEKLLALTEFEGEEKKLLSLISTVIKGN